MSQHFCEYDAHTNGRLGIPPCGTLAVAKWRGPQGEISGVRFHPLLQGKELEAAKAKFFEMMRQGVFEEEQN